MDYRRLNTKTGTSDSPLTHQHMSVTLITAGVCKNVFMFLKVQLFQEDEQQQMKPLSLHNRFAHSSGLHMVLVGPGLDGAEGRGLLLAFLDGLSWPLNKALVSPLSCWAAGLRKGLFVRVLLGMDLVIQKLFCQLVSIVNLQLYKMTPIKPACLS